MCVGGKGREGAVNMTAELKAGSIVLREFLVLESWWEHELDLQVSPEVICNGKE